MIRGCFHDLPSTTVWLRDDNIPSLLVRSSSIFPPRLCFDPVPHPLLLPRSGEYLFVVHSLFAPEREICLRLCAMAAVRTRDRRKNRKASAKTRWDSELQRNKDAVETRSSMLPWSFCSSKDNSSYKDLGCTELHWPAEDERELSQEIVRVNPLSRRSILLVSKNLMNEYPERENLSLNKKPLFH